MQELEEIYAWKHKTYWNFKCFENSHAKLMC